MRRSLSSLDGRRNARFRKLSPPLEGHRLSEHHRQMIRFSLEHLRFLEEHLLELDQEIVAKIEALGYTAQWQLLQTVPGVKENSAASVLAEVGPDMGRLGSEKNLSSWAGVCPGNNRSAGKNKGSKATKGNRWLRGTLMECAWGAAGKKNSFLKQKFWRLAAKKQRKPPATVAIAHTLLVLYYQVLKTGRAYKEVGVPVIDEKQRTRLIRHHLRRLGKLGIRVRSLALPQSGQTRHCRINDIREFSKEIRGEPGCAGDIAPGSTPKPFEGGGYELDEGELVYVSPNSLEQWQIIHRCYTLLKGFVDAHNLSLVTADTWFEILSRGVRAPDVAFVPADPLTGVDPKHALKAVPGLVIKVLGSSDPKSARRIALRSSARLAGTARDMTRRIR